MQATELFFFFLLTALSVLCEGLPKRGLVYVPNAETPQDDAIWVQPGAELSWYYTYNDRPNPIYNNLEFVPMMWGMGSNHDDTSFRDSVIRLIESGQKVDHVLAFNEPDMKGEWGGSDLLPAVAARGYVANFVPLGKRGIKLGMPAVSGAGWGITWLRDFVGNCTELLAGAKCPFDFLPVHWYDNYGGLVAHVQEAINEFPDAKIWVTEYAYAHRSLQESQDYYNQSAHYFDNNAKVERYSYFGAFRSKVSNVGPNATFLNNNGQLTDIGSWYLGGGATGVDPTSG